MYKIGITGGIGCGKSTLLNWLKNQGVYYIDADVIAREVVEKGSIVLKELQNEFGEIIIDSDGYLKRDVLAKIVFNDKKALNDLNEIMHSAICDRIAEKTKQAENAGINLMFYDVPLLIEINLHKLMDEVWVVWAENEVCVSRIVERNKITTDEAIKRIQSQMPITEKKAYADVLLENSGTIKEFYEKIEKIWETKQNLFTEV